MAEFALGLTKTAVEGTLSRVQTVIEEEAKLRVQVQNDLVFITGEFEMMQSFLKVANKERANNQVVRTWVRQLRTLAFDVEDCVEFDVHLDNKPAWWWRLLPSCVGPPRQLDNAAMRIVQLKARVEDLGQRNTRYNLISDSGSDSRTITVVEQPVPANANKTAFQVLRDVWEATGKWRGVGELEKLIDNEGDDLQVISVWGNTGGADLGTTPIFNKVYNDPAICQKFQCRAWVKLMTPFNPLEFRNSLLTQVHATAHETNIAVKTSESMEDDLMQQVMAGRRYLVILEEVTTMVEWDVVRTYLPDSKNGSRIVLSTKQLQTALFCAGKPYQVSDLTYHQPLLAFSKKALGGRSCKGPPRKEEADYASSVIRKVYTSIMYKTKQFQGVEFQRHSWVDIPDPFVLEVFARRLLLQLRSEDLQVEEISAIGMMTGPDLTTECCRFLCEEDCLVVINGLESKDHWDKIKKAFLSKPIRGIIVIAKEESVAAYCVDGEDGALLNMINDLEEDPVLRPLIKGYQLDGIGGKGTSRRGHVLSTRMEEARKWRSAKACSYLQMSARVAVDSFPGYRGLVNSLCGPAGAGKSTTARRSYYREMSNHDKDWELDYGKESQTDEQYFSWVDVPSPFDLRVFFQLLFMDFHSYDLQAKETAAIRMMEDQEDPVQWCRYLLHEKKYFVVINGLRCTEDWDLIKSDFLSESNKGHVFVTTADIDVATYCVAPNLLERTEVFRNSNRALPPVIKGHRYDHRKVSLLLSNRREEARGWTFPTFKLLGCQTEAAHALINCTHLEGVISVWGIAGVGKSALVRSVYSHIMLGLPQSLNVDYEDGWDYSQWKEGYTMHSWVDVPHPFNLADLSSRMLLDFNSDDLQAKENTAVGMMEGQDPIQVCRKFLCEEKCLVVIDGLLSRDDWDDIKAAFLPETSKSCIIVITNEASVARHCVNDMQDRVVNLKGLEADASLNLLRKVSGHTLTGSEQVYGDIIVKCGGIPKVLNIIGEYLKFTGPNEVVGMLTDIRDGFMVMLETKPEFRNLSGLFYWMRRYFATCPDLLKPCIFYLSVFHIGDNIRRRRLVRRWIAEGYCRDKFRSTAEDNVERLPSKLTSRSTAEENAERLFSNLMDLSIIQQQGSKVLCQVNGFFHGCIISLEDNLAFALEGHCRLNSQRAGQHLTIGSSWDRDKTVFESLDFSRVRSFTVAGNWESFFMSSDTKMRVLRVLDLEDTSGLTNDDLELIGKLVPCLKFLSIRGCKEITRLPDSLGDLSQLQTLDVKNTSIVMLPQGIIKLQKMQYIRAGSTMPPWDEGGMLPATSEDRAPTTAKDNDTESSTRSSSELELEAAVVTTLEEDGDVTGQSKLVAAGVVSRNLVCCWLSKYGSSRQPDNVGVKVPAEIGMLVALHTIGVVNVNVAGGKAFLKALKELTQLRKLRVCGITGQTVQELFSAICGHSHLESLWVRFDKDKQGSFVTLDCPINPPPTCQENKIDLPPKTIIKSLKLQGHVRILEGWFKDLHSLEKVVLEMTTVEQEDMNILDELENKHVLHRLCVKPSSDIMIDSKYSWDWGKGFPNLKVLEIDCTSCTSDGEIHVTFGGYLTKCVEMLQVHCTSGSSLRLTGIKELESLKEVWLKGSYGDTLKQIQQQLAGWPQDRRNKPVLKLAQARNGY